MNNKSLIFVIGLCVVSLLGTVQALQCYVCFYSDDADAVTLVENSNLGLGKNTDTCQSSPSKKEDFTDATGNFCISIEGTLTSGKTVVVRGGLAGTAEKDDCTTDLSALNALPIGQTMKDKVKDAKLCACRQDGCNSGVNLGIESLTFIFPALAILASLSNIFS